MKRAALGVAAVATLTLLAAGAIAVASGANLGALAPQDRKTVPAPIDGLEVRTLESYPPRYVVEVRAGLPSGCAKQHSHSVGRTGDVLTVTVLNSMPAGNPICTMIYGSYSLTVDLGSDFSSGTTYTVQVNDKTTTFQAQ